MRRWKLLALRVCRESLSSGYCVFSSSMPSHSNIMLRFELSLVVNKAFLTGVYNSVFYIHFVYMLHKYMCVVAGSQEEHLRIDLH